MFVFGLLSGRIAAAHRLQGRRHHRLGRLAPASYFMLAFAHTQPWEIYLVSTLLGVGLGLAFSAMSNLIVQAVPASPDRRGQRHERQHPHHRRRHRRGGHVQHRDLAAARQRVPGRVRLHPGLRLPRRS